MSSNILEVEFYTGPFSMAGQIDYPEGDGPFPTVLLVPGPPQHDRYGNVRGYKAYNSYFDPLVETINQTGTAVFRWDKGGTGKSTSGLSAPMNMVSAYKKMISLPKVDRDNISILAIGGGSAFVYRKWLELEEINQIKHLCLVSTGVNELKLGDLELPICLVAQDTNILRSVRALEWYENEKGHRTAVFGAESASEQLFDESEGKVNLFNDENTKWHNESLEFIQLWFQEMSNN